MKLSDAANEQETIEWVRGIFKAYVPESDSWAKPNFFDINATVIGGLTWSAINEAKSLIDARMNPQTVTGEYLDLLVAQPPLNLRRRSATQAVGLVSVDLTDITSVPIGYEFRTADEVVYTATKTVALVHGKGTVPVISQEYGSHTNALNNRELTAENGAAISLGIYGGYDVECDEELRNRFYTAQAKFTYFGSQCSMEEELSTIRGVSRSWVVRDGAVVKMLVLMEDKYPDRCGVPLQSDFDEIQTYFEDECRTNLFFCPLFDSPKTETIAPEIEWRSGQPDICEVEKKMKAWLRANYSLGDGIEACDIQNWLTENYGDYSPKIHCCGDYPAKCDTVYNCVELLGCGGTNE